MSTSERIAWPVKTREVHNHHFDSTVWNDFEFRNDDVIVATYGKCGTTWVQQVVGQLIFDGDPTVHIGQLSPWLDLRVPPKAVKLAEVGAQTHQRVLKSHLPVDALVVSPKAKYLYVGRDGRDVVWSMYNHHANANAEWYKVLNETPGLVGEPIRPPSDDICQYFADWLERDGYPFWPFWAHVRSWWAVRSLPNVMLLHFNDLKRDLPGQMRRIADLLGIKPSESRWSDIVEHCTFDWMKRNAAQAAPLGGIFWDGGAQTFINKGTNGRWCDTLPLELSSRYERLAVEQLGEPCARWLATGGC